MEKRCIIKRRRDMGINLKNVKEPYYNDDTIIYHVFSLLFSELCIGSKKLSVFTDFITF